MSAVMTSTRRFKTANSRAAVSRWDDSRPTRTRSAPASAKACAMARPSPRLPPVMSARLPSKRNLSNTLTIHSPSIDQPPCDAFVGVDPAVAQERPISAYVFQPAEVARDHEHLLGSLRSPAQHNAKGVADE